MVKGGKLRIEFPPGTPADTMKAIRTVAVGSCCLRKHRREQRVVGLTPQEV